MVAVVPRPYAQQFGRSDLNAKSEYRYRTVAAAARATADAVRLIYERDMRLALRDVEDALTVWTSERQRQISLNAAVVASQQALEHSTKLYERGLSAYLPVLVAQRAVNQVRDERALS